MKDKKGVGYDVPGDVMSGTDGLRIMSERINNIYETGY
jgi:hypothetical protein